MIGFRSVGENRGVVLGWNRAPIVQLRGAEVDPHPASESTRVEGTRVSCLQRLEKAGRERWPIIRKGFAACWEENIPFGIHLIACFVSTCVLAGSSPCRRSVEIHVNENASSCSLLASLDGFPIKPRSFPTSLTDFTLPLDCNERTYFSS